MNNLIKRITTVFIAMIILWSCQNSKSKQGAENTSVKQSEAPIVSQGVLDSLGGIAGKYVCKCMTGNNQIDLEFQRGNGGLNATIIYKAENFKASGVIHPDTINFDRQFEVWSFTNGKDVYGFRFAKDQNNNLNVVLINEDYKKGFNDCTDAKVIDFKKQ